MFEVYWVEAWVIDCEEAWVEAWVGAWEKDCVEAWIEVCEEAWEDTCVEAWEVAWVVLIMLFGRLGVCDKADQQTSKTNKKIIY